LVKTWIPSFDGIQKKLQTWINVADIGCGYDISTILMAKNHPKSKFFGYDSHEKVNRK